MAIKNYMINDKWLDIAKQNIVEVESTDGVIGSVKVNGQEYGGGGGSSDFSTAEVTIVNNYSSEFIIEIAVAMSEEGMNASLGTLTAERIDTGMVANVILYKGSAGAIITGFPLDAPPTITTSGNIQNMEDTAYLITGDCTITIS